jgi:endonuclease III
MGEVLGPLRAFYGPLAPPPKDLFAFFVWEVVSARTLPARRDLAWQALKRLPALTPDAMFGASKDDLEAALAVVGSVAQRIEALKNGSGHFRRHRDLADRVTGPLLGAARALALVPHLSRSAQRRALLIAGGHAVAPVDDGLARVLARLEGFPVSPKARARRAARRRLDAACRGEREKIAEAILVLGHHAVHACGDAPHCAVCPLAEACQHARAASGEGGSAASSVTPGAV